MPTIRRWRSALSTILVIDDLPGNRSFLSTLLASRGYRIVEAADGTSGLATVRLERPDLVITDVLMPIMDGYEFVRQLRQDPAIATTPVVFYTAHYGEREARALALSLGVGEILIKPAGSQRVLEVVAQILSGRPRPTADVEMQSGPEFDREHLRLLTDKLAAQTGDLGAANARLRALINLALEFASGGGSDAALQSICTGVRDLFGATYVTLGIIDPADLTVRQYVTAGAENISIDVGATLTGRLRDVVMTRRATRGVDLDFEFPVGHPKGYPYVAVPIVSAAQQYGWLCLAGAEIPVFSEDDEQLLTALAGQIGRIYELERQIVERQHAITERTRTEEALRTAEERMRFALEAAGVGVWDMDYRRGVLQWSDILEAQYGYAPGTFNGTQDAFVERVHPADRQQLVDTITEATRAGSDFAAQHRTVWPDGTVRWVSGAGRIHLDEHGAPLRGLGVSWDITERRVLEEQYRHAQKIEDIGRLAGGVAHDFNNLLTVILGYCELLSTAETNPGRCADLIEIQKAGERGARLTGQLLALSRKEVTQPVRLDLNLAVQEMRGMLGRLIRENVNIVLDLQASPAWIEVDPSLVEQMLLNLAVNAQDAMPEGGTLTIGTERREVSDPPAGARTGAGSYVVLCVRDTGSGITPEVRSRMFEPFFTTKQVGKGTGLGLATVDTVVALSGGRVDVESAMGQGTTLSIYLPLAPAGEPSAPRPALDVRSPAGTQTVLIVEDAEGLRRLTARLLDRLGYRVLTAATAELALRLFDADDSITVVLTDVVLPGTSGPALGRQILDRRPGMKVIYMSGYSDDAIAKHGVLAPGVAFLRKPFTGDVLGAKVREVLESETGSDDATRSARESRGSDGRIPALVRLSED